MRRSLLTAFPEARPLPQEFRLRLFEPRDLPSLAETLDAAFVDRDWPVEKVRQTLVEQSRVKRIWVIEAQGRVVATASERHWEAFPGEGYVHWVGTHPDFQGRGLGRALMLAVMGGFRDDRLESAILETDDFRLAAIALYLKLGFEPAFRHPLDEERWRVLAPLRAVSARQGRRPRV